MADLIITDRRAAHVDFADEAPSNRVPIDLRNEIATIARDVTQTVFGGGLLTNQDATLATRGGARGIATYDDLERDCHCFAVVDKRKKAVVAREWMVDAASEDPRDEEAAQLVRETLRSKIDSLTEHLLDATLKGFAVVEVMWGVVDGRIAPVEFIPRDQRRFGFDQDRRLRMLTRESPTTGIDLPERKFIVHRSGGKDGTPYGLGLGTRLFWPVFFKRKGITFWLTFADKFGSPTAVGKYPAGAPKTDQDRLLAALAALSQDAGVIVPEGMVVELLEAQRSGTITTYDGLCRYMDEQISEAVLGETGSTNQSGDGGSRARDQVGNEVRIETAKRDADLLSETLHASIITWVVDLNLPGARPPEVYRDFSESQDTRALAYRDIALCRNVGLPVGKRYFYETYNIPEPQPGEDLVVPPVDTGGLGGADQAAFAEHGEALSSAGARHRADQVEIDRAAIEAAADPDALVGSRVRELLALAEETGDLVTFKARLADLARAAPDPTMVEKVQRAVFAANLLGRASSRQRQAGRRGA